ncbi:unnamed protein product [Tilletia controversa]|nr:unnamed protein product [Tilletia controversa]
MKPKAVPDSELRFVFEQATGRRSRHLEWAASAEAGSSIDWTRSAALKLAEDDDQPMDGAAAAGGVSSAVPPRDALAGPLVSANPASASASAGGAAVDDQTLLTPISLVF